jgi:hypothetical protein
MSCAICGDRSHETSGHYAAAFTNAMTGEPYSVPDDIRRAATEICQAFGIRGISDPMYVANGIAQRLGRGDGASNFEVSR